MVSRPESSFANQETSGVESAEGPRLQTATQKFVIVCSGRTGSNFLVKSLNHHPSITCFWEIFNPNARGRGRSFGINYQASDDPYAYAQKHVWENPAHSEIRGYKVFYFHCAGKDDFWQRIKKDQSIKVIHLTRKNLFLKHLSLERAKTTGVWHPSGAHKQKYHDSRISIAVDVQRLKRVIRGTKRGEELFRNSLDKPVLEISYEGMANANDVESSFHYLGVSNLPQLPAFSKSAVNPALIRIENDREVVDALESIGCGHWYEEFADV